MGKKLPILQGSRRRQGMRLRRSEGTGGGKSSPDGAKSSADTRKAINASSRPAGQVHKSICDKRLSSPGRHRENLSFVPYFI
jgi:hypothetical protein